MAQKAATLGALSDGRCILGLGLGRDAVRGETGLPSSRKIGQVPICWGKDQGQAVSTAHELFRWFGGGWDMIADLPLPKAFDAASQFVRESDVAESIACGPDLDELVASVQPFVDAGFTDVALVQIGDESQDEFLSTIAEPLLAKLRDLSTGPVRDMRG